jgi:hypothetical protein
MEMDLTCDLQKVAGTAIHDIDPGGFASKRVVVSSVLSMVPQKERLRHHRPRASSSYVVSQVARYLVIINFMSFWQNTYAHLAPPQ